MRCQRRIVPLISMSYFPPNITWRPVLQGGGVSVVLLPLPPHGNVQDADLDRTNNNSNNSNTVNGSVVISDDAQDVLEDVVDGLEQRALMLEHSMTVRECLGEEMAESLSPFLSSR